MQKYTVGVVGATGLVGLTMLKVLEERNFPIQELRCYASERSVGKKLEFNGELIAVQSIADLMSDPPQIALFSAGSTLSLELAEGLAEKGCFVIDNSSAWRMTEGVPLVVPEVNAHELASDTKIIANPNCSTIQLVMVLNVIHALYPLKRIVISTYQSVSGSGSKAVRQFESERNGVEGEQCYPHRIESNCIPHCDIFLENDYTKEEMKLVRESRKIMGIPDLALTATAVRVPVVGGHSESVNIEFNQAIDLGEIRNHLAGTSGVTLQDDPENNSYPMPYFAHHSDEVYVGRIRRDESIPHGLNLWIVSDNIRKGAATNAVQIAEKLVENNHI